MAPDDERTESGRRSDDANQAPAEEKSGSSLVGWAQAAGVWIDGISQALARWVQGGEGRWMLDLANRLPDAQQWLDILPAELVDALCQHRVVLHPELTLPDVGEVLAAYRATGTEAACARMLKVQAAMFSDAPSRARIVARWRKSERRKILSHILSAHDHRLYGASVPAAIAQAEGLVAELVEHVAITNGDDLKECVDARSAADDLGGPLTRSFVRTLLAHIGHGCSAPLFNGHAILHGEDYGYGTLENSVRALSWMDLLIIVRQDEGR